jgi:hypothetical protein
MCPLCHEDDKEPRSYVEIITTFANRIARHLLIKPTGVNRTTIKCPLYERFNRKIGNNAMEQHFDGTCTSNR